MFVFPSLGFATSLDAKKASDASLATDVKCPMSCQYQKANDVITFQIAIIQNKVEALKRASEEGRDQDIRNSIPSFCESGSETQSCLERYKAFQTAALLQYRQMIARNETTMAQLTAGRQKDGTLKEDDFRLADHAVEADRRVPYVPTLKDLEVDYSIVHKAQMKAKPSSIAQQNKWKEALILPEKPKDIFFTVGDNSYERDHTKVGKIYMQDGTTEKKSRNLYEASKTKFSGSNAPKFKEQLSMDTIAQMRTKDPISYSAFLSARKQMLDSAAKSGDTASGDQLMKDRAPANIALDSYANMTVEDRLKKAGKANEENVRIRYDLKKMYTDIENMK